MDSKDENVELINEAIKKLLEEKRNRQASGDSFFQGDDDKDDDQLLLSRLLSQLESLKGKPEALAEVVEVVTSASADGELEEPKNKANGNGGGSETDTEEKIVKELQRVKKQNTITHWLLSIMIVITVAWQASEVTMFLKLKNGFSNPFKYIGGMVSGMLGGPDLHGQNSEEKQKTESSSSLPSLQMPDLPHVELPETWTGAKH